MHQKYKDTQLLWRAAKSGQDYKLNDLLHIISIDIKARFLNLSIPGMIEICGE